MNSAKEETYEQSLLDFTWKLLENRLVLPKGKNKEEIWKETLEILEQMFPRAVIRFLIQKEGWKKRLYIKGSQLKTGRLWENPEFKLIELGFSELSVQLLLELFKIVYSSEGKKGNLQKVTKEIFNKGSASENLLVHLLIRSFTKSNSFEGIVEETSGWNGWNQLTVAVNPRYKVSEKPSSLRRVLKDWGWIFPWMAPELVLWWTQIHEVMFDKDLDFYSEAIKKITLLVEMVFKSSVEEKREDWMLLLMEFFRVVIASYSGELAKVTEPLETLMQEQSHKVRQGYRDEWGKMLRFALSMAEQRQRIRSLHPVDRKAPQKLFLSYWESQGMDPIVERAEQMRTHLESVVG